MITARIAAALAATILLSGCMIADAGLATHGRITQEPAAAYQVTSAQHREIRAELPEPATVRFGEMAVMPWLLASWSGPLVLVCGEVETPGSMRSSPTPMRRFAAEFKPEPGKTQIGPLVNLTVDHEFSSEARRLCTAAERRL